MKLHLLLIQMEHNVYALEAKQQMAKEDVLIVKWTIAKYAQVHYHQAALSVSIHLYWKEINVKCPMATNHQYKES